MAGWQDWNYKNLDVQDDSTAGTGWQDGRMNCKDLDGQDDLIARTGWQNDRIFYRI
jgi:hypothetical protein